MSRTTLAGILLTCLVMFSAEATAQDAPARARLIGPQALTGGVLRCEVNDRIQLILEATSAKLQNVDLARFRPSVSSSNEEAVPAVVDDDPRSSHVLCAADGRAEVTYKIGNLKLCLPVLVGTARKEDSTPCTGGFTTVATSSGVLPPVERPDRPTRGRFQVPEWLDHNGVMSCELGNEWQLVLDVTTDKLEAADLTFYPPRVTSSNESVVRATVNEDPRSVQIRCASNGRSELTLQIADLVVCLPVLVSPDGKAEAAAPCSNRAARAEVNKMSAPAPTRTATGAEPLRAEQVRIPNEQGSPTRTPASQSGRDQLAADKPREPAVPVTGLQAYAGYGNVQLSWQPAPGARGYSIHRREVNATEAIVLTGEVKPDGAGVITDTTYTDRGLPSNQQYVYFVFSYYTDPNTGEYYFPPANFEVPRVVATVRDASTMPWLPSDWRASPVVKSAETKDVLLNVCLQAGPMTSSGKQNCVRTGAISEATVEVAPKGGAVGWIAYVDNVLVSASYEIHGAVRTSRGQCTPRVPHGGKPPVLSGHPLITTGQILRIPFERHKPLVCVAVMAVYPNSVGASGTPELKAGSFTLPEVQTVTSDPVYMMFEVDSYSNAWVLKPRDSYDARL